MTLGDSGRDAVIAAEPEVALATIGDVLLTPTRIYARNILAGRAALRVAGHDLHGVAHVTGGGLLGNVPRVLPDQLGARLDPWRWPMPSVMALIGALGGIEDEEIRATFNGGLGMVVVVAFEAVSAALAALPGAVLVGEVVPAAELGARYAEGRLEGAWPEAAPVGLR